MAEPETPERLGEDQVALLRKAIAVWVARHPNPDYPAFAFADSSPFSPRDLQRELAEQGPIARQFLRMTRFAMEAEPFEVIISRFQQGQIPAGSVLMTQRGSHPAAVAPVEMTLSALG